MPDPNTDAPQSYRKILNDFAGKNPYGGPMWRVCIAEHCLEKIGGIFHTLDDDPELSMVEQRPDGQLYHKKISDKTEWDRMREVPCWPLEGWILERWEPAHFWGTKEDWESQKSEDGITPMMGPYPEEGKYFLRCKDSWPKIPPISDVINAITLYNRMLKDRPKNLEAHTRQVLKERQDQLMARQHARRQHLTDVLRKDILPVLRSTSLNAQGVRNKVQHDLGSNSHFGANEIFE